MRPILLLLMLMVPLNAIAVPAGCFVADGDYYCYPLSFQSTDCDQYNMTAYNFGNYINSMCSHVNSIELSLSNCNVDFFNALNLFALADSKRTQCLSELTANESNRQEWVAYGQALSGQNKKQTSLIKKLRKACGTRCKKIK
jgi:hypothetical protein